MRALWSEKELADALGAAPSASLNGAAGGVSIDSRTLERDDIFFAIKGESRDGHDHVADAFAAGAAAAVVRHDAAALAAFGPVFLVGDTLLAMERLGVAARARTRARIIAVTGSVGKTSAKEMLRRMLAACGPAHASAASYNNHWGVPLTLARMPADARFGVFEIGMNHAGEIALLARMARPHVALITTIAPVHIEHLGSLEAIADAKAEVFLGFEPGGVAVLNRGVPQFDRLAAAAQAQRATVRTFGSDEASDARLLGVVETDAGSRIAARILGRLLRFDLGAPGAHMAENALGALLAADALGADLTTCAGALGGFSAQKGRGARISIATPDGPATIIDESYNANPASMRAALKLLGAAKPGPNGRRIAVIGDMLELGPDGAAMHAELASDLEADNVDLLFGAGPLTRALYDAAPAPMRAVWAERSEGLEAQLAAALRGGDVVMVKGSNASRMGPLVAALRERFARTVARGEEARC
jgi:UDP-N-acetylmuramoyl-tripeptide--D-alanyl-D-alanine ligase